MKKFYTVFFTALLALVCSASLQAQEPLNFTVNVPEENSVKWREGYSGEWVTLEKGENTITINYDGGWYNAFIVAPVDGFRLDELTSKDPDSYPTITVNYPLESNSYWPDEAWNGRVYDAKVVDLNASRTAKVTINVTDDPSAFSVRRKTGPETTFAEAGSHEFRFDPAGELPIIITAKNSVPLYKVRLNDKDVPYASGYSVTYTMDEVADGSVIDITSTWPSDLTSKVTINVPEEAAGAIKSVGRKVPGSWTPEDVDFKVNEPFTLEAGYNYVVSWNTAEFVIGDVRLNGELQSASYQLQFFADGTDANIDIQATVKVVPKFILKTARDGEVTYSNNGYSYSPLPAGETEIVPTESYGGYWSTTYIKAAEGFRLSKVACEEAGDELTMPTEPSYPVTLKPQSSWEPGRVYVVEASNLDAERTASVTITVADDPSLVTVNRGSSRIELGAAGEAKVVKFNPEIESVFEFRGQLVPLNVVKHNGTPVPVDSPSSVSRTITVADGDNIEITAAYPAELTVPVTIHVPAEAAGVVSLEIDKGSYVYETVEFTPDEPIEIAAGTRLNISFNRNNFNLKSAKIGDADLPTYGGSIFVLTDPIDIYIDAAPWRKLPFTIIIDDPSHISVYPGESAYAEPYTLEAGENHFTIEEQTGCIMFKPKSGFQVNSVTDAQGNPVSPREGSSTVYLVNEPDLVFNISTGELAYDNTWVFWLDTTDNLQTDYYTSSWASSETREQKELTAGYLVNKYAKALDEQFQFFVYTTKGYYIYLNGELYDQHKDYSKNMYLYFDPENQIDVLRMYTTGEPAQKYALDFITSGDKAAEAKVVTDMVVEQPAWSEGLNLLEQTRVAITLPAEVENATVKLDDTQLEANGDGEYVFTTSAAHTVTISTPSSILDLDADKVPADNTVYNLMGVKVLENASPAQLKRLPAGIYIVNGQKRVVR